MLVFWWTGKGYLTPVIVVATVIVFVFILRAVTPNYEDDGVFWGLTLAVAGVLNWIAGRKQNARKLAAVRSDKLRDRLIYRARHKFMSLPFEVWSIPLVLTGLIVTIGGFAHR